MKVPILERIANHLDKQSGRNGCWLWDGQVDEYGYPKIWLSSPKKKALRAQRVVLENKLGRPLGPGMEACHTCDVRRCLRPKHLYEGTHQQNMRDRDVRGRTACGDRNGRTAARRLADLQAGKPDRQLRGAAHPNAKLTTEQAQEVRMLYARGGITQSQLGGMFDLPQVAIWRIVTNRSYAAPPLLASDG